MSSIGKPRHQSRLWPPSGRHNNCLILFLLLLVLGNTIRAQPVRLVAVDEAAGRLVFFDGSTFGFLGNTGVGAEPRQPAVVESQGLLYVPNRDSNSVSVVNWEHGMVVTTVNHASFNQPVAAAANLTETEVWVLNRQGGSGDGSISIISTANNSVVETLDLASFSNPVHLTFHRTRRLFHVVNSGNSTVTVINEVGRVQRAVVNVGSGPSYAVVAENDGFVFTANNAGSSLTRINTQTFGTRSVALAGNPRTLAVAGDQVYATLENQNVASVDIQSGITSFISPLPAGGVSYGLGTLSGTVFLFVGDQNNNRIHAVNPATGDNYGAMPFPLGGFTRLGAILGFGQNNLSDLSLAQTDSEDPVRAGQPLTYFLKVRNAGPAVATNLLIEDMLAPNTFFDSAQIPGGECLLDEQTVRCTRDQLGFETEVSATIRVIPQARAILKNQAVVSADQDDPNEGDNFSNETTEVLDSADVELSLMADMQSVPVGGVINYSVLVRNNGPSQAEQITMRFRLPLNSVVVSTSTAPANCRFDNSVALCNLSTLASLAQFPLSFRIAPLQPGRFQSTAEANSLTFDPDTSNNYRFVFVDVTAAELISDMTINKRTITSSVEVGGTAQFGIILRNFGPDPNQLVRWSDAVPSGFSFLSVSPSVGCALDGNQVICELGEVPVGQNLDFLLSLKAEADVFGEVTNQVRVEGLGQDPDPQNNTSADTILILGSGDFNNDGKVDAADLQELILEINDGDGESVSDVPGGGHPGTLRMDLNHDGLINQSDILVLNKLMFLPR